MKDKTFETEINYIKDKRIKNSLINMINLLPDYFFEEPASSTGKYHPAFSLGKGGLVRHTKTAVRIAIELFNDSALNNFNDKEKDLVLFSIILHDGLKSGMVKSEYTKFEHPILMSDYIKDNIDSLELDDEEVDIVCNCIARHMGPWTKDYQGNEVLTAPQTKLERFVHMCDYLASRKFLDVKFENDKIVD